MVSTRIAIVKSTTFHVLYEVDHEERDALSVHLDILRSGQESHLVMAGFGLVPYAVISSHVYFQQQ